jgi:hypothetical protein
LLQRYEVSALGSLDKLLHDNSLQVEWRLALRIALDVAEALRFAHSCSPPVMHGSLSSRSVLLCSLNPASTKAVAQVAAFRGLAETRWYDDCFAFGALLAHLVTREQDTFVFPAWCPPE